MRTVFRGNVILCIQWHFFASKLQKGESNGSEGSYCLMTKTKKAPEGAFSRSSFAT